MTSRPLNNHKEMLSGNKINHSSFILRRLPETLRPLLSSLQPPLPSHPTDTTVRPIFTQMMSELMLADKQGDAGGHVVWGVTMVNMHELCKLSMK